MATILENVHTLSVHLEDAYAALEGKGATIPQQKNATNLSATVDSLPAAGFTIDDLLGTTAKDLVINVTEIKAGDTTYSCGGAYNLIRGHNTVKTVDFPNLVKVNRNSCTNMFYGCTNLTELKSLPATTVDYGCYMQMFRGCTSLTSAPSVLPATNLNQNCYGAMFRECTSLTSAPALPVITLAYACCSNMFYGCGSLTGEVVVPIANQASVPGEALQSMFQNCPNLTKVTLDFTRLQQVPTLGNANSVSVFGNTSDTRLEIRVPAALEASWKTATNWSTWSSHIVGV